MHRLPLISFHAWYSILNLRKTFFVRIKSEFFVVRHCFFVVVVFRVNFFDDEKYFTFDRTDGARCFSLVDSFFPGSKQRGEADKYLTNYSNSSK